MPSLTFSTTQTSPDRGSFSALTRCPSCARLVQRTGGHCLHCHALMERPETFAPAGKAWRAPRLPGDAQSTLATTALVIGLASLVLLPLAPIAAILGAIGWRLTRNDDADPQDRRFCLIAMLSGALVVVVVTTAGAMLMR